MIHFFMYNLEMISAETKTRFLSFDIEQDPECLIPERLLEIVECPDRLFALSSIDQFGRLDQEYFALTAIIAEQGSVQPPRIQQVQESDRWATRLNALRLGEILRGTLREDDGLLIFLQARPFTLDTQGVYVDLFLEAPNIRKNGIGRAFFDNLAEILCAEGYNYMCGESLNENEEFYWKTGWEPYKANDGLKRRSLNTIRYIH